MAALQESAATDGYASYGGYDAYSPEAKSTDSVGYAWSTFFFFFRQSALMHMGHTFSTNPMWPGGPGQKMSLDAYL